LANAPTWNGPHFDVDHDELARIKAAGSHSHNDTLAYGEPLSSEDLAALYLKVAEAGHRDDSAVFAEEVRRQMIRPMAQQVFSDCAPTYATSHRWNWPDENGVMRCACGVTDLEDDIAHAVPCRIYAVAIEAGHSGPVSVEVLGLWADDYNLTQLDPVEAERQRCERLGVVWVGPDVQEVLHGPQLAERDAAGMLNRERLAASRDIVRLGCELREADGVRAR